jgi:hypothetical protein
LIRYRRYQAPPDHGEPFFDPPLPEALTSVTENIRRRQSWRARLNGQEVAQVAAEARQELAQLAATYTSQYLDPHSRPTIASPDVPLILAGHQPQLFHVGVWFKNFVLDRIARRTHGVAINLIVDNDLSGSAAIRVPTGSISAPRVETVPYDRAATEIPYEERFLLDRSLYESFGRRVHTLLEPLIPSPLLDEWWPTVIAASIGEQNLGRCVARSRHRLEAAWGVTTLEVPLSIVCETNAFRGLILHLLGDLPAFHEIYNSSLFEYRRVNHVRSRSHPVPPLEQMEDWYEAPLWVWTRDDPRRRRLYARAHSGGMELTDLSDQRWRISNRPDVALGDLARHSERGIRIRPRALVTTMFARLLLCDLFVHGIGGGKYDQLTDAILARWLAIDPPRFLVATVTAKLPMDRPRGTQGDLLNVTRTLRDLTFHPERHLEPNDRISTLTAEKKKWLAEIASQGSNRARHEGVTRINAELQKFVADQRARLVLQRDQLEDQLRKDRLLGSREYAFCLFPKSTLQALLLDNA